MSIKDTSGWMPYDLGTTGGADITNEYLGFGLTAGLGAIALFVFLLTRAYSGLGRALAIVRSPGFETSDRISALGFGSGADHSHHQLVRHHLFRSNWRSLVYATCSYFQSILSMPQRVGFNSTGRDGCRKHEHNAASPNLLKRRWNIQVWYGFCYNFTMRRSKFFTFVFLATFSLAIRGFAADIYVAQTTQGADNGTNAANAHSVAWFNTLANWGTGLTQIGPGCTVHLCGIVSKSITFQSAGSASNPITLLFEPGPSSPLPLGLEALSPEHLTSR